MSSSNLAIEPDYIDVTAEVKASTVMTKPEVQATVASNSTGINLLPATADLSTESGAAIPYFLNSAGNFRIIVRS